MQVHVRFQVQVKVQVQVQVQVNWNCTQGKGTKKDQEQVHCTVHSSIPEIYLRDLLGGPEVLVDLALAFLTRCRWESGVTCRG